MRDLISCAVAVATVIALGDFAVWSLVWRMNAARRPFRQRSTASAATRHTEPMSWIALE
jgi:hypothetical protein